MDGEDALLFDAGSICGVMYQAGPDHDPDQKWSFDCGTCGRIDIQVTRRLLESTTASLLTECQADDTPRTERLAL
jgi:hypothetical protein